MLGRTLFPFGRGKYISLSGIIVRESEGYNKTCTCTTLEHRLSELHNWLPTAGRDMDSANDLDMALRDAVGLDAPAGVGSRFIR